MPSSRPGPLVTAALLLVVLVAGAGQARAEEAAAPASGLSTDAAPTPVRQSVAWRSEWPRFRVWEYAGTAALALTSWYVRNYRLPPAQAKWQGDNWFDDTIRGWLRADTPTGRWRAQEVSNWLAYVGYAVPFGVDIPVTLLAHRQVDVAWQMLAMDAEAFVVAGLINNILFYEVGRGRPSAHDCAVNPQYDPLCNIGANASMPSGHTLTTATGAGLTCVHHHYLPLYGQSTADRAACGLMIATTVATATARIMADRHYATDSLAGMAIGFASGYGLPWLLHYRDGAAKVQSDGQPAGPSAAVLPIIGLRAYGMAVTSSF